LGLSYSRGRDVKDAVPAQYQVNNFESLIAVFERERAPQKDGAEYFCGPMAGDGRRCADSAAPRRFVAVDIDQIHASVLPDLLAWFGQFSGCGWPTHSSGPHAPRARVIIELDREATREQCIAIGQVINDQLAQEFGTAVYVDPSTYRGEQPVFLPPTDVAIARYWGKPLVVSDYLKPYRVEALGNDRSFVTKSRPREPLEVPRPAQARGEATIAVGGRNNRLSRLAFSLRKAGRSVEQIEVQLRRTNRSQCTPPLSEFEVRNIARGKAEIQPDGATIDDFFAHMPTHHYLYEPTRELWPAASVNGRLPKVSVDSGQVSPTSWLDHHRAIEQMIWHPGEPKIISNRLMQISGWVEKEGTKSFNLYRPPVRPAGDATMAKRWLDHLRFVYPDDFKHVIDWMAFRVQRPGQKCNHALVLGGRQGIGKDSLLEPLKTAVGSWNWSEISPSQMLGQFNGWTKAVVVRVNEARDLGDVNRFAFYDHSKVIIAAPPDVLRVNEKHLRETYVVNCCGMIITTNHLGDGLYLPADDRRHYVAWSPRSREDLPAHYWNVLWGWYENGGIGHVCAYLAAHDLSDFDPKAPPPKTPAFWQIVSAGESPESGELRDLIESLGNPEALTLGELAAEATSKRMVLADEIGDRKSRRAMPHKLERVNYVPVRNPDAEDGLFKIGGKRQAVYAQNRLEIAEQLRAARKLS
jgi:hypothetical protein